MLKLKRNFWNGLLAGSIVGAILGIAFAPQTRSGTAERIREGGLFLTRKAQRLWKRAKAEPRETLEKTKH